MLQGIQSKPVNISATCNQGSDKHSRNEHINGGGSRTHQSFIHTISFVDGETKKLLRLIDTPGVNDTRGDEQDNANFDDILSIIKEIGTIHAICILLKPNEARLTLGLRHCLDSIFGNLHKNATKNIAFCFTHTRGSRYKPGDTLEPLREYLHELGKRLSTKITADKNNIFCFDNDCFRNMCIKICYPYEYKDIVCGGWEHNVAMFKRLCDHIQTLTPHTVEDTTSIDETRKILDMMSEPVVELLKEQQKQKKEIEGKWNEIERLMEQEKSLQQKGQIIVKETREIPLPFPQVICLSSNCTKKWDHGADFNPGCDNKCELDLRENRNYRLYNCKLFDRFKCTKCGCSDTFHYQQYTKTEVIEKMTMSPKVETQLSHLERCKDAIGQELESLQKKEEELNNESKQVKGTCYEFSSYLQINSTAQMIDPFLGHFMELRDKEKEKKKTGETSTELPELNEFIESYKKEVERLIQASKIEGHKALEPKEIFHKFDQIMDLKFVGPRIRRAIEKRNSYSEHL